MSNETKEPLKNDACADCGELRRVHKESPSSCSRFKEANSAPSKDEVDKEDMRLLKLCQAIVASDKTPEYAYHGLNSLNGNGMAPPKGARWITPEDLATQEGTAIIRRMQDREAILREREKVR